MTSDGRNPFVRSFSANLQDQLTAETLFTSKLRDDIQSGEVFAAIRNCEMHFYHRGGRLFAYDGKHFRTNVKYALTKPDDLDIEGDIHESDLHRIKPITQFANAYSEIKALCQRYAEPEAQAVAKLYQRRPYTKYPKENMFPVVLDIEASFSGDTRNGENSGQDRIDLVLFDPPERSLLFIEVKLFSNPEIRASAGLSPPVVSQIERYEQQISERRGEILNAYVQHVSDLNHLFGPALLLPPPVDIVRKVPLLIMGFDEDQRAGKLEKNRACLEQCKACCLTIGKANSVSGKTLLSWFEKARSAVRANTPS